MAKRKSSPNELRTTADALCKAARDAFKFVDPNATIIDLNASSIKQGDIKEKLRQAILDYQAFVDKL